MDLNFDRSPSPKRSKNASLPSPALDVGPFEKFGREFFKTMSEVDGNYVASPLGCHFALGMVLAGAKGQTLKEMAKAMDLPEDAAASCAAFQAAASILQTDLGEGVKLKMANKAYLDTDLEVQPSYQTLLKDNFGLSADVVKFTDDSTTAKINEWAEEATEGKITELIDGPLPATTELLLLNAIYFKGKWANEFEEENTSQETFFTEKNQKIKVPMMYQCEDFEHAYLEDCAAQVLVLPYKNHKINMILVLPDEKDGLKELEKKILQMDLSTLLAETDFESVEVSLPKFKVETSLELQQQLSQLGLGVIFTEKADLSGIGISKTGELYVDSVIQKAVIEVNEEGTEAAAVTSYRFFGKAGRPPKPNVFKCDHPFLYFITYENDFCLFGGRVTDPNKK